MKCQQDRFIAEMSRFLASN